MSLLTVISCERTKMPETQPGKDVPFQFSLDTKSLGEDDRTYRIIMTTSSGIIQGNGTYCSMVIEPGATGKWLSPCYVDNNGAPLTSEGTVASSFEEADKASKYGLRFGNPEANPENVFLSVASPAVQIKSEGYYDWSPDKELYLSNGIRVAYEGSWANYQYVFPAKDDPSFKLLDRRAKLFVHIACDEQPSADIQSITLKHVTSARWYPNSGFATSGFSTSDEIWFTCNEDPTKILHLVREEGDVWDSPAGGQFILPLDYSDDANNQMRPIVEIKLGTDIPKSALVSVPISENIEPMKVYTLNLKVSKSHTAFELLATDWEDGGTYSTPEKEKWATIARGVVSSWNTPNGDINTDDWNTTL